MNILFVCSINKVRSRTAEFIYSKNKRHKVRSAGTETSARVPVTSELIKWADKIFVMEEHHEEYLKHYYTNETRQREIIVLDITDFYFFMEPKLVKLIKTKVDPYLEQQ